MSVHFGWITPKWDIAYRKLKLMELHGAHAAQWMLMVEKEVGEQQKQKKRALTDMSLKLLDSCLTCRVSASTSSSRVARSPTSSCLCSLAHVSTVSGFFLIGKC